MAAGRSHDASGIKHGYVADVVAAIRTLRACAEPAHGQHLRACAAALARGATDAELDDWRPMARAVAVVCGTDQGHPRILPSEVELAPVDIAVYRRADGRWVTHQDNATVERALVGVCSAYDAIVASFVTATIVSRSYESCSSVLVDMARAVVSLAGEVETLRVEVQKLRAQRSGSGSLAGISSAVC